jgi:hypothetical protein
MESGPPKIVEALVYWLLPPACREEVLGDMRERNQGSTQYLTEATGTVPSVIYSRIQRTTAAVVAFMEVVSLYTAFVMSAWWLDHERLFHQIGFARLAIPPVIFMSAVILADAYSNPTKRWLLKPLFGPTFGFALTFVMELNRRLALPVPVLAWGGALGFLMVSTLRFTFPPVTEGPQAVKFPAFWQRLELSAPSFNLKGALLSCVLLLAIVLYLAISRL